jgi:cbb3-type cytochrome oxidase maturation protein
MEILFFLIGCSVLVAATFLGLFFWATRSGQYDDLDSPAYRMLWDTTPPVEPSSTHAHDGDNAAQPKP